jgi:hypothetical protein
MEIKFWHSCGFVGSSYSMDVNGKHYSFGFDDENECKIKASKILLDEYSIDIKPEDIKFVWDGTF